MIRKNSSLYENTNFNMRRNNVRFNEMHCCYSKHESIFDKNVNNNFTLFDVS